ncbi:outer membrane protein PgaA [Bremerella volcania]|uniref:Outer membrane protein PgaA n=1 Tax=Bremerella volcania TaxID=2527984 RepID=A0A518C8Z4_9BACT|nr:tetratricopeptide repeat protein [Bremerella volcania]QDU75698.1 outer membrane protein PgaA [Bremerella volcania]
MSQRSKESPKQTRDPAPTETWASQLAEQTKWLRVVLVVAVVAAYLTSLGGTFVFDDFPRIVERENLDNLASALRGMARLRSRSTTHFSFAINAALFGKSAFYFHLVNLLIHVVSVLTLFELVRGSIAWWNRNHPPHLNANLTGFVAALLWGVHPLGTMAVTYIVQRHESLMAMFYLLTLYCLLRGRLAQTAWPWYIGSILCCWLGMGAKEIMVTAPLVALVYDRCFLSTSWRELLAKRVWVFAMFLVPATILFIKNLSIFKAGTSANSYVLGAHETASAWLYLWTQAGVIVHYLYLSFWPVQLTFDYDWPVANQEREYLLPAIFVLGLLVLSFWLLYKRPAIGFVAIAFFFILAPTSSIVPIIDVAFEHRMYLPLACLCVLAAMGLNAAVEKWRANQSDESKYQTILLVGLTLAVLLGIRTAYRNLDYHSQIALWTTTVEARPMNLRANHNLAQELRQADRLPEAEQTLLRSIAYCEQHGYESFPLHGDLAELHVNAGQFDQAYERFQVALNAASSPPENISEYHTLLRNRKLAETRTSYGALLDLMQRPAEAARQFDLAIELRPDVAQSYVMAGHAYRKSGNLEMALARWKKAVELEPGSSDVARDYTMLLVDAGHYREAAERLQQYVQQNPDDLPMQFQLARIQAAAPDDQVRNPEVALKRCDRLLKAFPQHAPEIQQVEAMARGNAGQTDQAVALLETLRQKTPDTEAEVRRNLDMMSARFRQKQLVLLADKNVKR